MVESALRDSIACFKIEDFHNLDHGQKNLSTRNWPLGTFVFVFVDEELVIVPPFVIYPHRARCLLSSIVVLLLFASNIVHSIHVQSWGCNLNCT